MYETESARRVCTARVCLCVCLCVYLCVCLCVCVCKGKHRLLESLICVFKSKTLQKLTPYKRKEKKPYFVYKSINHTQVETRLQLTQYERNKETKKAPPLDESQSYARSRD